MSKRVNITSAWMFFLGGAASSLIIMSLVVFSIMRTTGPQLTATIRGVPWELPDSVNDEVEVFESLRDPNQILGIGGREHVTEEMKRFAQELAEHVRLNIRYDLSWLGDIKSVYIVRIMNKGKIPAENIFLEIPGAKIVEVGRDGKEELVQTERGLIPCKTLPPGRMLLITAWTTRSSDKEWVEKVRILHATGPPIRAKVEAFEGPFARLIDRTIVVIFMGSPVALAITILWWRRKRKWKLM